MMFLVNAEEIPGMFMSQISDWTVIPRCTYPDVDLGMQLAEQGMLASPLLQGGIIPKRVFHPHFSSISGIH